MYGQPNKGKRVRIVIAVNGGSIEQICLRISGYVSSNNDSGL